MPTRDEAMGLFDRRRRAWLAEDLEAYLALWADDLRFRSPSHAEPIGRAAFAELVRRSYASARPLQFDVTHLAVDGDLVLAEWVIAMSTRAEGRRIEWWGMSVANMRDGLIHEWREYWNPADMLPR
jgi:uncharacterized protein (TIGR02246 family)